MKNLWIWLKVIKITPPDGVISTINLGCEQDTRTKAINTSNMLSSLFYGYPQNDCAIDKSCFVSKTVL